MNETINSKENQMSVIASRHEGLRTSWNLKSILPAEAKDLEYMSRSHFQMKLFSGPSSMNKGTKGSR